MNQDTQLSKASGYDINRMMFSKPQKNTIPNTKPPISYTRIGISSKNRDGSIGDLVFETNQLFSFGVSENKNPETGKVNGYVLPLCMWNKEFPTDEEKAFTDTFNKVCDRVKDHILEVKEEIEKYDLNENSDSLKKINPLYWKRVKGKIVDGTGPTLYVKLIQSKKDDRIISSFRNDADDEMIDPLSLVGKYCYVRSAIKIESIFVGKTIALQVKLYEARVRLLNTGIKSLLSKPRPVADPELHIARDEKTSLLPLSSDFRDDDTGSIDGSDSEEEKPMEPKKVVKKVVKKKI